MTTTRYTTTIVKDGSMCYIPVPFDPKPLFGKVQAPVKVTLNGYTFRSTIAAMGGGMSCLPFRKSNREAAKLEGTETLEIQLDADVEPRVVDAPKDLVTALKQHAGALAAWRALSYTHQKEHVDAIVGAKAAETRTRRIAKAVAMVTAKKPTPKPKRR